MPSAAPRIPPGTGGGNCPVPSSPCCQASPAPNWRFCPKDHINLSTRQVIAKGAPHACLLGTGPGPVYFGSGYLPAGDYWRLGAIFGVIYIVAFLLIGVPRLI
ncbi:anion permease [Cupriavidus sp. AcVe19-1a]|uniref:anion permease n=1 Tax=Cupriavidus sp. AcVe19-1a TaxID=2821359 RepID=UPI001AE2F362|nr:anion permease [Cupriavidus sp. AcVe19-1a]MBP0630342.1 anion permease [Cupriavidus sp. AcVe19-1a]